MTGGAGQGAGGKPPKPLPPQARLFVIMASKAQEAVIFRRGPSAWFHVIRWDTKADTFHPGAWLRGRIYPQYSDISPDGELLLCLIHQGRSLRTSYTDSWTAVSRTPWLHALALWPQGTTYDGGGRFLGDRQVALRGCWSAHPKHPPTGLDLALGVRAPYHASSGEVAGADWSGRDQRGRLVFSVGGKLMCRQGPDQDTCLADFTACIPAPRPAPDAAQTPLKPLRKPGVGRKHPVRRKTRRWTARELLKTFDETR
jgi:hypothetical protein